MLPSLSYRYYDIFFFYRSCIRLSPSSASHRFNATSRILFLRPSTTDVNTIVRHSNCNLADPVTVVRFLCIVAYWFTFAFSYLFVFLLSIRSNWGKSQIENFPRREIRTFNYLPVTLSSNKYNIILETIRVCMCDFWTKKITTVLCVFYCISLYTFDYI